MHFVCVVVTIILLPGCSIYKALVLVACITGTISQTGTWPSPGMLTCPRARWTLYLQHRQHVHVCFLLLHSCRLRNMNQECYANEHLRVYIPIGIVCSISICLAAPVIAVALVWHRRKLLDDHGVMQLYGFLYQQYK